MHGDDARVDGGHELLVPPLPVGGAFDAEVIFRATAGTDRDVRWAPAWQGVEDPAGAWLYEVDKGLTDDRDRCPLLARCLPSTGWRCGFVQHNGE